MTRLSHLRFLALLACLPMACTTQTAEPASPAKPGAATGIARPSYAARKDVQGFIDEVVGKQGLDRNAVATLLGGAQRQQSIIDAISKPAEHTLTWAQYRKIFITDDRIKRGVEFYNTHRDALKRAEKQYGVPPEIIVAIIGVETRYGQQKGRYRVIDALSTLAFDYPPRADFFRNELREYLLLERDAGIALDTATGSYAGAMGFPQFMPSSYRNFAVDFNADNKIDLINDPVDAIGSVASYFKAHKWISGQPVVLRATYTGKPGSQKKLASYVVQGAVPPARTAADAAAHGLKPKHTLPPDTLVAPMKLDGDKGDEYWLGLNNFYVITRYNHSNLYAMAVHQLSTRIKDAL